MNASRGASPKALALWERINGQLVLEGMQRHERSNMRIVAIVSGGMDSVTLAHFLRSTHPDASIHLLSFDYGQRHAKELWYAEKCADDVKADWHRIDLSELGALLADSGSVLVDHDQKVPEGHYAEESMKATVVPNRNAIMLSIAAGVAVAEEADFVAIGVHAGDHFIYPDCRPEFIVQMSHALATGNEGFANPEFYINAPFVKMTKTDIAELGDHLGVDYSRTWSCYNGRELHCGKCGTCVERQEAFRDAGVPDPTEYESQPQLHTGHQ